MSSPNEGAGDKPFDPSPARLEKARRDGDIATSRETIAAASYVGLFVALLWVGGMATDIAGDLRGYLMRPSDIAEKAFNGDANAAWSISGGVARAAAMLFVLPALCTFIALAAQQAIVFTPSKLAPKLSRISLPGNAKKKFGPEGMAEFSRTLAKLVFILILVAVVFSPGFQSLPAFVGAPSGAIVDALRVETFWLLGSVAGCAIAIAAIDLPLAKQAWRRRLRMSHDELRQESKENDGDPQMRQSRRDRGRAIATNRMLNDVPSATVIVVNPTHFAVALRWSKTDKTAPVCVAKGVDELAHQIIGRAGAHGVPIRRDAPTARALYASVEIGAEIDRSHFAAVAAAIHYAEKIRRAR